MALSLFGRGRLRNSDDPFESLLFDPFSFSSASLLQRFPKNPSFARDIATVANTQVDWKETAEAHIFKANLLGLAKEDVKVQVEDGRVLQISGGERKKEESSSGDTRWHRVERAQGSFLRRFRLPDNAKVEEVKAGMENGVLIITMPKAAPPEPKAPVKSIGISG